MKKITLILLLWGLSTMQVYANEDDVAALGNCMFYRSTPQEKAVIIRFGWNTFLQPTGKYKNIEQEYSNVIENLANKCKKEFNTLVLKSADMNTFIKAGGIFEHKVLAEAMDVNNYKIEAIFK